MKWRAVLLLLALLELSASIAHAHELQPAYLELRQTSAESFNLLWKVPVRENLPASIHPLFPDDCKASEPLRFHAADTYIERSTLSCAGGLDGRRIGVEGLTTNL